MRDETVRLALPPAGDATERPISIAIVAMGGQGGGVLTDWIVQLAENHLTRRLFGQILGRIE